jgi:hypothetical protein
MEELEAGGAAWTPSNHEKKAGRHEVGYMILEFRKGNDHEQMNKGAVHVCGGRRVGR